MKTPTPWLYGLAVVVVLNIVESLFNGSAIRMFRLPLMFAAYAIGIALFFELGVGTALALWWGIGLVMGLLLWSSDFRRARYSKDADLKRASWALVRGLFVWPIVVPLTLLAAFGGFVVNGLGSLCYSVYKKLLPHHVPHYRGIEGCKEAAISGDARARFTLGNAYEHGDFGLPQDYAEAAKWYRKAAEQNHHNGQLFLGVCLAKGQGGEKNVVEGLMWIALSEHVSIKHGGGYLFRDAAHHAWSRTKAQMTQQQVAEALVMLESSPLYKETKEVLSGFSRKLDGSVPAPEKSPPAARS